MKSGGYRYVQTFTDRHGTVRHYFRRKGTRIPVPPPGTPEFRLVYRDLLAKQEDAALLRPARMQRTKKTRKEVDRRRARKVVAGVYLLMRRGRVVYVGTSEDMPTRVATHSANGRQFDRAYFIAVPSSLERMALEALLIAKLQPEQNRNPGSKPNSLAEANHAQPIDSYA